MLDIKNRVIQVENDTEPVTLAEAKNYLRVSNTEDDNKITSLIKAARSMVENYINRDVLSRQREMFIIKLDGEPIEFQYAPINSTAAISIDIDGESTDEDTEWELVGINNDPYIKFLENEYAENVSITYTTAGLSTDDTIKQGTLAILYCLYENEDIKPHLWSILKPKKRLFV